MTQRTGILAHVLDAVQKQMMDPEARRQAVHDFHREHGGDQYEGTEAYGEKFAAYMTERVMEAAKKERAAACQEIDNLLINGRDLPSS